ncbi:lysophospholipase [Marivirga lumbricoides]|uniref:Lysophospholipase n=1 Tax=Marivirga lumbricoides TaxID=1046115 RepID=A0ABQ1L8F8_9BACT|nr:lysophospholipase [Marivirga lumbricoides]
MQSEVTSFKTSDNLNLEILSFSAIENPEKVLLIIHGHGDYAGRYVHVAEHFATKNINSAILTLRGHGNSEGKRGHASSMEQLLLDVEYFVRKVRRNNIDAKLYLYGHSMGGNIVLNYLLKDQSNEIEGAIITSPWIKLVFQPAKWKVMAGNIMADIIPSFSESSGLDASEISTLPDEVKKYKEDQLIHDKISARLFKVITKGGETILSRSEKFHHPVFIAHGLADKITDAFASKKLADSNSLFSWHGYEGNKHEIQNDVAKEQLLQDIEEWLKDK